ncbi:hypothetical protein [Roseibium album]|uniref:Uncharacterized protein n=1 Tax=Roseibium album TaxID=311410 RepID=A0A0M6Z9D7_9HYPH|nr:hypothetical protein [Roseibium album]CTQ58134.1 hypothetical protein LA5094_00891 [Roseibium album]CTQ65648.1 hypothetical protein LA5096_00802 [Roseibium album]CTQ70526.1 hypothetical protein LA5095_01946 [Roseibium album]
MRSIINQFRELSDRQRSSEIAEANRRKWFIDARQRREQKQQQAERAEDALSELAASVVVANSIEIERFRKKLDVYEEATVHALMENGEALDLVQKRLDDLLSSAFVLDNGRKVFRTQDGQTVYDEHGQKLGQDEFDPATIPDAHPTWEEYEPVFLEKQRLLEERQELIEFQEKLDHARERTGDEELAQHELQELEVELEQALPDMVAINFLEKGLVSRFEPAATAKDHNGIAVQHGVKNEASMPSPNLGS